MSAPEPHEPVTVSIARKVLPGREAAYEEWIKGIATAAASSPATRASTSCDHLPEPTTNTC